MIKTLLEQITDILEGITGMTKVYDFTATGVEEFPCAVVLPTSFDNKYLTNQENLKGYTFKIFVYQEMVINGKEVSLKDYFLPMVDSIIEEFDNKWDGNLWTGNEGSNNRIWATCESGEMGVNPREQGDLLYAELRLTINLSNNI